MFTRGLLESLYSWALQDNQLRNKDAHQLLRLALGTYPHDFTVIEKV